MDLNFVQCFYFHTSGRPLTDGTEITCDTVTEHKLQTANISLQIQPLYLLHYQYKPACPPAAAPLTPDL